MTDYDLLAQNGRLRSRITSLEAKLASAELDIESAIVTSIRARFADRPDLSNEIIETILDAVDQYLDEEDENEKDDQERTG